MLNQEERKELLKIARETVRSFLIKGEIPQFKVSSEKLKEKRGVFVTLKKDGYLRGCLGSLQPIMPLYQAVAKMAISSAFEDPRFPPLNLEELEKVNFEISVLSPLKRIKSWQEIKLGQDGVLLVKNGRSGLFLPQVAKEFNWTLEEFLSHLCQEKIGLPRECWREEDAQIYVFSAEVFAEKEVSNSKS